MKKIGIILLLCVLSTLLPLPAPSAHGVTFDPNNIISNEELFNSDGMTALQIQEFLQNRGSSLASYLTQDIDGQTKRASDIIWRSAQDSGLNPKAILVILQKEQSLIESSSPSQYNYDWATGYARCDSCGTTEARVVAYKGFTKQVDAAAKRTKYYTNNPWEFNFRAGLASIIDGTLVTPVNSATAALYNYTPHLHGNFNFWKLWLRYFGKFYPDGLIVREEGTNKLWLIQGGKKRQFASFGAFASRYSTKQIVDIKKGDLDKYEAGSPIKFPQYSLLQAPKGGVYLFADDQKFAITSKKVFKAIGFNPDEIIAATQKEIDGIPLGGVIDKADLNPAGELLQDKKTGGIYHVVNGVKHPIWARELLSTNFAYRKVVATTSAALAKYADGEPVKFVDGTILTSAGSGSVYVISNGLKRPVASKEVFESLGFDWNNIITTNDRAMSLHEDGDPIVVGATVDQEMPADLTAATQK